MTPKYGNCKDCAAWMGLIATSHYGTTWKFCKRRPPNYRDYEKNWEHPATRHDDGCFDHIPAKEEGNG
jgi:hypothetical protein